MDSRWSDFFNISSGCTIDGMASSCGLAMQLLNSGSAELAPPTTVWAHGQWNFVHFDPNTGQYGITPGGEFFEPLNSNGNAPQNTNTDPCANLLPANIPSGVNIDENIRVAEGLYRQATRPDPDLGGSAARGAQPFLIFMDSYNRVKSNGPWDYKRLDPAGIKNNGISKYDEFGNFNFGATGAA